jgi:hypothetical protein
MKPISLTCDPNDFDCIAPISLPSLRGGAAPQTSEDAYIKAICGQLQSSKPGSSDHATIFLLGQAFGYLAGKGQEVQMTNETAQLVASNPSRAASLIAPALSRATGKVCIG